jgi:hypothetical protein
MGGTETKNPRRTGTNTAVDEYFIIVKYLQLKICFMKKNCLSRIKKLCFLIIASLFSMASTAQGVAINTTGAAPDPNAMLDVKSTSKGILIPRIDYNNRPVGTVETGMLIFVTANGPLGNGVFYYYDGTQWLRVKNNNDKQSLALAVDTLKISESNYVIVGDILNLIGYYKCAGNYTERATDPNNCGACGTVCSYANASGSCVNGGCAIGICNTGFGNCNNNPSDGCEINLTTNINNCGNCGTVCSYANATASCTSGTCNLAACNAGFANCDGNPANGCEINKNTNPNNCGACGVVCSFPNATPGCAGGLCSIIACNSGFANCDGNPANGCEINKNTDVNNCGNCNVVCFMPNATPGCSGGLCVISACNAGFSNCDGNTANGCEVNINTNVNNCGACGIVCSFANATANCTAATCGIASCNAGFLNCDGITSNGCEINKNTNSSNCGTCGHVCTFPQTCVAGVCQ